MLGSWVVNTFAPILLAGLLLSTGACQKSKSPAPAKNKQALPPKAAAKQAPKPAAVATADSLWLSVLAKETTWKLPNTLGDSEEDYGQVEITLHNRREHRGTVIAELSGTYFVGGKEANASPELPGLIVADGKHALVHYYGSEHDERSDEEWVQALKREPSHEDPPKKFIEYDEYSSTYLEIREHKKGALYCMAEGPPDDDDFMCDDTCFATLCFSKVDGIVVLDGTWAPEDIPFAQPGYDI